MKPIIPPNASRLPVSATMHTADGTVVRPIDLVLPVCRWIDRKQSQLEVLGSGFAINAAGLFLTAKHVVLETEQVVHGELFVIQFIGSRIALRPLDDVKLSANSDAALGLMRAMRHNTTGTLFQNPCPRLSNLVPHVGTFVGTVGYPRPIVKWDPSLERTEIETSASWSFGHVLEIYAERRDRVMLDFPSFRIGMVAASGQSGSPVFDESGDVCGVITTAIDGQPESFAILMEAITSFSFPIQEPDGSTGLATLRELSGTMITMRTDPT